MHLEIQNSDAVEDRNSLYDNDREEEDDDDPGNNGNHCANED